MYILYMLNEIDKHLKVCFVVEWKRELWSFIWRYLQLLLPDIHSCVYTFE